MADVFNTTKARGVSTRIHILYSDNMEPTIPSGSTLLVDASTTSYKGEGIYVVDNQGCVCVYRCQLLADGKVRLINDLPEYPNTRVALSWFNERCLGRVMMTIDVALVNVDRPLMAA